jgi:hypothetical protein
VPDLVELSLRHIVSNFATNSSILNKLPAKHRSAVLKRISTDLPLKVTARLVDDDDYWRRCCQARWTVCDVSQHGGRWKRMFFERNLEVMIESFEPESPNPAPRVELEEALELSSNYVRRLRIRQLLPPIRDRAAAGNSDPSEAGDEEPPSVDHFDFNAVLPKLPFLEDFEVTYGVRDCGMNFDWDLFQFTARDCRLLADCVAACRTLRTLKLHRSKVDDEKVRVLVARLLDHPVLVELDLSHNVIGDRGARALGKLLNGHSQLTRLGLADNRIRSAGAQALAHALTRNDTLKVLDLRLNHLGDDGGQVICKALLRNSTLTDIGLAGNELTEPTASLMAQVVTQNSTLETVDLSCNRLGQDGGRQLQEGMEQNRTMTHMDLRLTECGQEAEYCINQVLMKNRERRRTAENNRNNAAKKEPAEGARTAGLGEIGRMNGSI